MTKEELVIRNYTQKIALAKLALVVGVNMSLGIDYSLLREDYRVAKQVQKLFDTEIVRADYDTDLTHDCVATLHHLLSRWLPKGIVQISDSAIVPVGSLKQPPAVAHEIYYGWKPTSGALTVEEIEESVFLLAFPGVNYTLPFQETQEYNYVWFAEPITEPIKTDWEAITNPLNKGQIGGGGNLFRSPIEVGDYRFYISNYATVMEEGIIFLSGGEVIPDDPEVITPSAPIVTGDDDANTLIATHAEFPTEIVVSENNGPFEPYTETILVGDIDRAAGYWKFKIKAGENRNESAVTNSPAFTHVPVVVEQYTLTVNLTGQTAYTVYVNGSAISGNTAVYDEGTVLDVIVVKPGFEISPAIQDNVVMDGDKTLTFTAEPVVVYRTLTIVVNGLDEPYQIWIDGVEQSTNTLQFVDGTILDDVEITIDGYTIEPTEFDNVVMNQNRTLIFNAAPIQHTLTINTGGVTNYDVYIDDVLHTGPLVFNQGTVLNNVSIHKVGYTWSPVEQNVTMDADKSISFVGTPLVQYTLTVNVTGTSNYTVRINGVNQTGNTFQYYEGAIIDDIRLIGSGYNFSPSTIGPVTMDENKTVNFTASVIPTYSLTINVTGTTGYTVTIDGEVQPSGVLTFNEDTVLNNIVVSKAGWVFSPTNISSLTMDENKVLNFTASEVVDGNYLPGFEPYNPKERYSRINQGGASNPVEISPGLWQASNHRIDFIGFIRVPIGGEYAQKVTRLNYNIVYISPELPWADEPDNWEAYVVWGYSAGVCGRDSYYGNSSYNRAEVRHWSISGFYDNTPLPDNSWLIYRRETRDILNIYSTDGFTETLIYSMDMTMDGPGGADFMYLKHTCWKDDPDDGRLPYPQSRNCFHEVNDTFPPYVNTDTESHYVTATSPYGDSEILYSEDDGVWQQYTEPIKVANEEYDWGYLKFKVKAAEGRPESPFTQSEPMPLIDWDEGLANAQFTQLQNLTYSSSTNTYTTVGSGNSGIGFILSGSRKLPVNGSAAIYWNEDSITETRLFIGFNNTETSNSDTNIRVRLNKWFNNSIGVGAGSTEQDDLYAMQAGYSYRLVCRMISEVRIWTVENLNDWVSYNTLHTFSMEENQETLYPVMWMEAWNGTTISGLRYELYIDENVSEVEPITPDAPTITGNDTTNSLSASHALGNSEILVSVNNGVYVQYTGAIAVGNVNRAIGYWKFKTKAAPGRNESPVADSPAFTESIVPTYDLTVSVTGTTGFTVTIDGVVQPSNIITVEENTVLENIVVTKAGWTFDPVSVPSVTMDENKTLNFTATAIPETNIIPGFTSIDLSDSIASGGTPVNTDGTWNGFEELMLSSVFLPVNGEIAIKVAAGIQGGIMLSNNEGGTGRAGVAVDASLWHFINDVWTDYPRPQNGDFIVLKRTALDELSIYVNDLSNSTLIFTVDLTGETEPLLRILFEIYSSAFISFPQGKDLAIAGTLADVILTEDDSANTITATHEDIDADIYVSENNGAYVLYTGTINVGNVDRASGYWKFEARKGLDVSSIKNSSAFTREPVEGISDLTFGQLGSIAYDAGTKTYTLASDIISTAYNANNILSIGGSAAIYFPGTLRNFVVGFHAVDTDVYKNDLDVSVEIRTYQSEIWFYDKTGTVSQTYPQANDAYDYRIICRMVSGARVWKVEYSTDAWDTYTDLFTFPFDENTRMFPILAGGSNENATASDLRFEVYKSVNID